MKKCRDKKQKRKIKRRLLIITFVIFIFLIYIYFSSTSLVINAAGSRFNSVMSNCSYYAVAKCIDENIDISDVCEISKDKDGNVVFIGTNVMLADFLCYKMSLNGYDFIKKEVAKGFDVPIGAWSGVRLFSGLGRTVNVKFVTVVSVQCDLKRTFTSAGINQTRQVLSAVMHTDVDFFLFSRSRRYSGDVEVVLYDNLIVGKVPEVYLNTETIVNSGKN